MKRRILSAVVAACIAAALVCLIVLRPAPKVDAASCSNSTLSGTYGGYFWGSQNGTLTNSVVVISFDGTSAFSLSYWNMNGGSSSSGTSSGSYSVNSNCEGTLYDPNTGTTYDTISIVSSGSEVDFLNNASGANISGVVKKQ